MLIHLKTDKEFEIMHDANKIVHDMLSLAGSMVRPGVTTKEIDTAIENSLSVIKDAKSAFKGYKGPAGAPPFPAVACISVNEEVVHGIPGDRALQDGDIVTVDFGVYYKGFAGDSARTFAVGNVSDKKLKLIADTKHALSEATKCLVPGGFLYDIANTVSEVAHKNNYGNLKGFSGHGIGKKMHEKPPVFNYIDDNYTNVRLRPGMALALEPMFTLGSSEAVLLDDKWTVITKDRSVSCHYEVSVAITKNGPKVLGHGII